MRDDTTTVESQHSLGIIIWCHVRLEQLGVSGCRLKEAVNLEDERALVLDIFWVKEVACAVVNS